MNELHHRGLKDILVAVIDGLNGFPEAVSAVYPDSEIQTCFVHLIRNSLSFCNWKDRKPVAAEFKNARCSRPEAIFRAMKQPLS
jgi:putative transposase